MTTLRDFCLAVILGGLIAAVGAYFNLTDWMLLIE